MSEKYTIGDLAKRLNITTRMIRYYDQKDLVKPDSVSENGYRMYSIQQVRQLQLIIFLKGLGFSLNDVQKILNDHHRNNLLELLLEKQKNANQKEIEN